MLRVYESITLSLLLADSIILLLVLDGGLSITKKYIQPYLHTVAARLLVVWCCRINSSDSGSHAELQDEIKILLKAVQAESPSSEDAFNAG